MCCLCSSTPSTALARHEQAISSQQREVSLSATGSTEPVLLRGNCKPDVKGNSSQRIKCEAQPSPGDAQQGCTSCSGDGCPPGRTTGPAHGLRAASPAALVLILPPSQAQRGPGQEPGLSHQEKRAGSSSDVLQWTCFGFRQHRAFTLLRNQLFFFFFFKSV